MNIPIIRIEIDHMRQSMAHAFTEFQFKQDEIFNEVLKEACSPENLKRVMAESVSRNLNAAIEEEVRNFYAYGKGREVIRELVCKKLEATP